MLITIASWSQFPLDFSVPCPFFHIVLKHSLLPVGLGFASPFAVQKAGYTLECLFFYLSFCLPMTQDLFLPNLLARIRS